MAASTPAAKPQKARTAIEGILTVGGAAIALILLNTLTCQSRAKLDLTESGIYSLSEGSAQIVRGMPEKVNIKAYFGNVPAEQKEKQTYVDMLLSEYEAQSGGRITYEKIDPWNKPELQQELKQEGIDKLRLRSLQNDKFEQVPMYFHVVFSHLDKKEVWTPAQGFALEGLEYEYTMRIKRLGYGKKKVGVTTGFGEPAQAQVLGAPGADVLPGVKVGLGDLYEVTSVDWSKTPKSIEDVDVLVVNGPSERVSDAAKYYLDQFIMKGKPVLLLVRGMKWQAGGNQQMQIPGMEEDQPFIGMPADSGLGDLLASYGFQVGQDAILDVRNTAYGWIPPGSRQGMLARGLFPLAESLQKGDKEILSNISVLALPFASTLKLVGPLEKPGDDFQVLPLLRTSPTSFARKELIAITREMKITPDKEDKGPFLVGVAVSGKWKSFFDGKPVPEGVDLTPPAAEGDAGPGPAVPPVAGPLAVSPVHTRMVVVSAPSFVDDTTLGDIRQHGDVVYVNGFVAAHDMVDWLAEDTDLIAVRGKKVDRPLKEIDDKTKVLVKYGNAVGAPLLLIVLGVIYWRIRESRRRRIKL